MSSVSIFSHATIEGNHQGLLTSTAGKKFRGWEGYACRVFISEHDNGHIDVRLRVYNIELSEVDLEPSFDGSNLYEPKYRISRARSAKQDEQIVVFMDPQDTTKVLRVTYAKYNNSTSGVKRSFVCEITHF